MTKVIFESETEIGKCDFDGDAMDGFHYAEPDYAEIWAHTVASVTKGLLKIEQHCYLRHGEELPEQSWVRPEIFLEPAEIPRKEMLDLCRTMHAEFISRSRERLQQQVLVH